MARGSRSTEGKLYLCRFRSRGGVFAAAPGLGGGGWPAGHAALLHPRLPWRCAVDQRWPRFGRRKGPFR